MSLTILSFLRSPSKKTSIPKGNMISNGEWSLLLLEQDRTTSDFLGIVTLAIGQESSRVDILLAPARLFGFTLEPMAGGMGCRIDDYYHRTDYTSSAFSATCGQHLPSCDQHQTGLAWEVVQPAKDMNILKISFAKGNKIANSPKTPAQQFYELTIKEAFIF